MSETELRITSRTAAGVLLSGLTACTVYQPPPVSGQQGYYSPPPGNNKPGYYAPPPQQGYGYGQPGYPQPGYEQQPGNGGTPNGSPRNLPLLDARRCRWVDERRAHDRVGRGK